MVSPVCRGNENTDVRSSVGKESPGACCRILPQPGAVNLFYRVRKCRARCLHQLGIQVVGHTKMCCPMAWNTLKRGFFYPLDKANGVDVHCGRGRIKSVT